MGVVSRIHGYNSRWWAAIREHPNEYQVSVVDPIEGHVLLGSQPGSPQQIHAPVCHGKIWVQLVIDIFRWMNIGHRTLHGVWICGHFDFVSNSCPVGSLDPVKQLIQGSRGMGAIPLLQHVLRHLQALHHRISSSTLQMQILPPASWLSRGRRSGLELNWPSCKLSQLILQIPVAFGKSEQKEGLQDLSFATERILMFSPRLVLPNTQSDSKSKFPVSFIPFR